MNIQTPNYPIYFGSVGYEQLNKWVTRKKYSKIFVLGDTNTNQYCLPVFLQLFPFEVEIIEIDAGEAFKNIETCLGIWEALSDLEADRKSLLINIGGGVVTDLGGFVASTYNRGIDFVNIPTSLLAMVDASVGGKTGVDLGNLKNRIGVINTPKMVLIDTDYLVTLSQEELCSGLAEMLKHGLIHNEAYWLKMSCLEQFSQEDLLQLIYESVTIKDAIVRQDPTEKNIRKVLNFGHTLGHAIESFCLQNPNREKLLHGQAIAIGMVLASFLSVKILDFSQNQCDSIQSIMSKYFQKQIFTEQEIAQIIHFTKFDKKNSHGNVNFVLLKDIAQPVLDCQVGNDLIYKAFEYYMR